MYYYWLVLLSKFDKNWGENMELSPKGINIQNIEPCYKLINELDLDIVQYNFDVIIEKCYRKLWSNNRKKYGIC